MKLSDVVSKTCRGSLFLMNAAQGTVTFSVAYCKHGTKEARKPRSKKKETKKKRWAWLPPCNLQFVFSLFFFLIPSSPTRSSLDFSFFHYRRGFVNSLEKQEHNKHTEVFFFLHTPGEHTVSAVVRSSFFCFVSKVGARERRRKVCRTVFHTALPKSLSSHFWVPCPFLAGGNWRGAVFEKKNFFFTACTPSPSSHTHALLWRAGKHTHGW